MATLPGPFVRYWQGRLVVSSLAEKKRTWGAEIVRTDRPLTFRERFMWRLRRRVPTP